MIGCVPVTMQLLSSSPSEQSAWPLQKTEKGRHRPSQLNSSSWQPSREQREEEKWRKNPNDLYKWFEIKEKKKKWKE